MIVHSERSFIMKIVLLESLGISPELLNSYVAPLQAKGIEFAAYERSDDAAVQIEETKDADILIIANMPLKAEVIEACPKLKYIDVAFTGVDHVALDAAKAKGIAVSNASGYSTVAVAELTLGMMLSLLRFVPQVDAACRAGGTKAGFVGTELEGKTVGLVGTGAIGGRVAQLVHAFGAKVIAYNGFSHKENTDLITYVPMKELMAQADIVSLHCPVTPASKGLINGETISWMKPTAILINAARGPVVDSQALADALNNGKIAGAGIDVFETEPPLDVNHPLLHAKNTIVTPHVAFATQESMQKRAVIVFDNIDAYMAGKQKNIIL
jgi:phosphoglycerate dehydrogenase-like enzyme